MGGAGLHPACHICRRLVARRWHRWRMAGSERSLGICRRLVALVFFLLSLDAVGQAAAAPILSDIRIYAQDDPVRLGETFFIYIDMPAEYGADVSFGFPPAQEGLRYWAGPLRLQNTDAQRATWRYTYRADEAGYAVMEPFTLRWPETSARPATIVHSDSLLIPVTIDGEFTPPELEWNIRQKSVYVGQTMYISLDMYHISEVRFPDFLDLGSVSAGILEEVTGLGELDTYEFHGRTFSRIPLATFLYTPLQTGTVYVPNAGAQFGNYSRNVQAEALTVHAAPEGFSGNAVGSFAVSLQPLPESINENGQLMLEFTVSGEGNFGILELPQISVQNAVIEGSEEMSEYETSEKGYRGSRSIIYRIQAGSGGEMSVTVPSFSWVNPQSGIVETQREKTQSISIIPGAERADTSFIGSIENIQLPISVSMNFTSRPIGVLLALIIPLYLFIYFSVSKKWTKNNAKGFVVFTLVSFVMCFFVLTRLGQISPEDADRFYQAEAADTASVEQRAQLEKLLAQDPDNVNLLLSRVRLEYYAGNFARAMFSMRQLVNRAPLYEEFRQALILLEEEMELGKQHPISRIIRGDWIFLIIVMLLMSAAVYLSVANFSPRLNIPFAIISIGFIIILFSAVGMYVAYSRGLANQPAVIEQDGGLLKKIPDADADEWIVLPAGTSVALGVSSSGYVQIRTAYGIVAWVQEDMLFYE